jgi:hypothetical protein
MGRKRRRGCGRSGGRAKVALREASPQYPTPLLADRVAG